MNDRFKFRCWDKTRKIMETFNNSPLTLGGLLLGKNDDYEINQCTGLKDKNGKLIYEGDIVEDALMNRFTITFNEEYLSYLLTNIKTNEQMVFYPNIKLEVIGNIYENKELLESEGE